MSYPRSLPSINDSRRPLQVASSQDYPTNNMLFNSATVHSSYAGFSSLARDNRQGFMSSSNPPSPRQYEYRGESRSRCNPSIFPRNCSPTTRRMKMDENQNPIHDEAVEFVSSSRSVLHKQYRKSAVEFVRENFKCPVCLDVMIEATGIKCGHIFCRYCIQNWSATKSTCPVCGEDISTVGLKLYDIDNAIDSISFLLSDEWKTRRMLIETINPSPISTENVPTFDFTNSSGEGFAQSSLEFLKNTTFHTVAWFWRIYEWIRENLSLEEGLAMGVVITCVTIIFFFFMGDRIINFIQYMYYALTSYRWNSSIGKQLGAMQRVVGQNKYQEFYGPDNTIFVRFIKLFYDY